jgi:hypothetical protein
MEDLISTAVPRRMAADAAEGVGTVSGDQSDSATIYTACLARESSV